jgi:hypothetical protein
VVEVEVEVEVWSEVYAFSHYLLQPDGVAGFPVPQQAQGTGTTCEPILVSQVILSGLVWSGLVYARSHF